MHNIFACKRTIFLAKLCLLVSVVAASSPVTGGLEDSRKRGISFSTVHAEGRFVQQPIIRYGRKPAAVTVKDDNDFDIDLIDPHLSQDDLPHIGLERENKEDAPLLSKTKDVFDGKKLAEGEHEMPLSFKDLGKVTNDLGLSDEDLKDLDDLESGKVTLANLGAAHKRNPDERPHDVPPPPGMVANPHEMKKVVADLDLDRVTKLDQPPAPEEPTDILGDSTKVSTDEANIKLVREKAAYEERVLDLTHKLGVAQREIDEAKTEASHARRVIHELKVQRDRSKSAFQSSLESAREEEKIDRQEMSETIKEQKRAFEELLEEKQLLSQMLSDEQKMLKELQEKIQHPDLGLWVRQRAEKAAILVETPETDAVKYYAKKYMAPKVTKMRHRLELLEKRVERTVDHLLPAKYGSVVALLLSLGLVGFPIMVTMSIVVSLTKSVSLRQYVLLGNVFLTAFATGLCIAGVLLRQDPLQTLYEASETLFITLQLTTAVMFPIFLGLIGCTVLKSRDRLDAFVFGCEFVFYSLVAMNYRSRVWRPAMLGQNIETSVMMYAIYLMDFMSMTALTISSARIEGEMLTGEGDPEVGLGSKVMGITGSGALNGSVSSRFTSLSSGLIQAATGHGGRTGKEE